MTPRALATPTAEEVAAAFALGATIPDFPKPGIEFFDVLPIFADPNALQSVLRAMLAPFHGSYEYVAGAEARGFLIAGAAAATVNCGLIPIRKSGKLPRPAASEQYELEYGEATLEVQRDLPRGSRILVLDDVLATGGTLAASVSLLQQLDYEVAGVAVMLEIAALEGRDRLRGINVNAVKTA